MIGLGLVLMTMIMVTAIKIMIVLIVPILVVSLLNVIEHGVDVHKLQQPLPPLVKLSSLPSHVTNNEHDADVGRALYPIVLTMLASQSMHVKGSPSKAPSPNDCDSDNDSNDE